MKIEFYMKDTGEVLEKTDDDYFVMNDEVWRDNGRSCESQEASVGFDDFITHKPNVGWRVVN